MTQNPINGSLIKQHSMQYMQESKWLLERLFGPFGWFKEQSIQERQTITSSLSFAPEQALISDGGFEQLDSNSQFAAKPVC
jgi:hypothetical protein